MTNIDLDIIEDEKIKECVKNFMEKLVKENFVEKESNKYFFGKQYF